MHLFDSWRRWLWTQTAHGWVVYNIQTIFKMPKISVIMPNYNAWKYISEAIQSVLNQTFGDFEFIIIDDCSTDNSWEIIQEFAKKDSRIIALRNAKNLTVCRTANRALDMVRGEFIARLDSDDVALPERFSQQLDFLEKNPEYILCGSNFQFIDQDGKVGKIWQLPETNAEIQNSFLIKNPIAQSAVMIRASMLGALRYDENFEVAEDLEFWMRLGTLYKMYNLQKILVQYRIHGKNSVLIKQKQMIKNTLLARKKAKKFGYKMNLRARFYYFGTWCMQFLPSKFVWWLYKKIRE